ncbi:DUF2561 family protein [Mycobacterium sp. NPDC003449]
MTRPMDDLDNTDRILLGASAVAWLVALGAAVAAIVALVDLGRGTARGAEAADTPWLLYTVIGISVAVIAAAIPLLLRARAQAGDRRPTRRPAPAPARRGVYPGAPTLSRYGRDGATTAVAEQLLLRFTLAVTCAMGVATAAIGLATYLMATESDIAAWCCYGVAGLVTVGMVALPVVALRRLDAPTG